jgi:hypothetical protein
MADLYNELKRRAIQLLNKKDLLAERVRIRARPLSVEEAIGNPEADDFPLQKGNEKLMQAEFMNAVGKKPVFFYRTTMSGAAHLMGWEQFCACAR